MRTFLAAFANRIAHNVNPFFYPLSPDLLTALVSAFRYLERNNPALLERGAYYEFGVFKGFSVWFADRLAREFASDGFRVFGFDSFAGLPRSAVDRNPFWRAGNYRASLAEVQNHFRQASDTPHRVTLIRGLFSSALFSDFLREHGAIEPAILVVDSDIYESGKSVLDFWLPRMPPGSVLILDECRNLERYEKSTEVHGEQRALIEVIAAMPQLSIRRLSDYGRFGSMFCIERSAA